MIKASELRPGNMVYRHAPQHKEVITVEEVRRSDAPMIRYFVKSFLCPAYENELSGIPLTEEWLEKFGFDDTDSFPTAEYEVYLFKKGPITFRSSSFDNRLICEVFGKEINSGYVHQLQNLYHALTGEELQIKES
jgi:hypothetical protein